MEKICQHCGVSYEGSPQSRFHSDACRKAFAREQAPALREQGLQPDGETPIPQAPKRVEITHPLSDPPEHRSIEVLLSLPYEAELTEQEENVVRSHFGYGPSEKRTRAQRAGIARKIRAGLEPVGKTVTRYALDGTPVAETVGPAGLSLKAFPRQFPGELTPSPSQLKALGETVGSRK